MLYEVTPLKRPPLRIMPLPIMVDPIEGEALISWCHRLGACLGLNPAQTALMLGIDGSDPAWWHRPDRDTLSAISMRSGVALEQLRSMTLLDWRGLSGKMPKTVVGRSSRRLHSVSAQARPLYAACPQCLAEDRTPSLRLNWLTGWATVCPIHETVLIERCWKCRFRLRTPTLEVRDTLALSACSNCGANHYDAPSMTADTAVLALQERMLGAMQKGKAWFPGLRTCAWSTTETFIEQISSTVWSFPGVANDRRRQVLFAQIAEELNLPPIEPETWERAYGLMLIAAWMLQKPSERWSVIVEITSRSTERSSEVVMRPPTRRRTGQPDIFSIDKMADARGYKQRTRGSFCEIGHCPDAETLQRRAAFAMNDPTYRKLLAIARCREGAPVPAIVEESGFPHSTVYRWWLKYRPEPSNTLHTQLPLKPGASKVS